MHTPCWIVFRFCSQRHQDQWVVWYWHLWWNCLPWCSVTYSFCLGARIVIIISDLSFANTTPLHSPHLHYLEVNLYSDENVYFVKRLLFLNYLSDSFAIGSGTLYAGDVRCWYWVYEQQYPNVKKRFDPIRQFVFARAEDSTLKISNWDLLYPNPIHVGGRSGGSW